MRLKILLSIGILSLMIACVTVQQSTNQPTNYSYHYNPGANKMSPEFLLVSQSESKMRLYIKLKTRELRFSKANSDVQLRAEPEIMYLVVPSFTDRTVIDSSRTELKIRYNNRQKELVTFFDINTENLKDFIVYIKIKDKYSENETRHFVRGMNKEQDNRCRYLIKHINGKPIFNSYVNANDTLIISKPADGASGTIFVKYYSEIFPPAYAPFDTEKPNRESLIPDDEYTLSLNNWQTRFAARKEGLYHFQTDTAQDGGILLYAGRKDYPDFTTSDQLIEPLIYITQSTEYELLTQAENKKLAIDKFWLEAAKNKEKARHLIRVWYTRAKYANVYFTSYKEGWKTDRGMVYMLFGPPDILNYNDLGEKWIYRRDSNNGQEFQFINKNPDISARDYNLKRNLKYTNDWYRAVDSWRQGQIYE
jgi:GWxTD domain-containing protein